MSRQNPPRQDRAQTHDRHAIKAGGYSEQDCASIIVPRLTPTRIFPVRSLTVLLISLYLTSGRRADVPAPAPAEADAAKPAVPVAPADESSAPKTEPPTSSEAAKSEPTVAAQAPSSQPRKLLLINLR